MEKHVVHTAVTLHQSLPSHRPRYYRITTPTGILYHLGYHIPTVIATVFQHSPLAPQSLLDTTPLHTAHGRTDISVSAELKTQLTQLKILCIY